MRGKKDVSGNQHIDIDHIGDVVVVVGTEVIHHQDGDDVDDVMVE